jgi:hypothetical protein
MANIVPLCTLCQKRIRQHEITIQCSTCYFFTHCNCLPTYSTDDILNAKNPQSHWSCTSCLSDLFPFFSLETADEFNNPTNVPPYFNINNLENMLFDPFELNDDDANVLDDIDPDTNFYNLHENSISNICKYYYPETLGSLVKDWTHPKNLSLMHLNIRSLSKNFSGLNVLLKTINHHFSIIATTETWIKAHNTTLFELEGYSQELLYRPTKAGGGTSMYISDKLNYKVRPDLDYLDNNIEMLWVELDKTELNSNRSCLVGTIYR